MSTPARNRSGWRLGSIAGTPVYLAPSWLLVAAMLTLLFLPTVQAAAPDLSGPAAVAAATSFPILLFVSVFAHELAHGAVARALGIRVREYVLTFWGGHTSFGEGLRTPGISAAISVAGPIANLVLAGLGWFGLQAMSPGLPAVIVASLTWSNLVVAGFNLLPGNPLDGGRILEALIWKVTGNRDTGAIGAGWVGRGLAVAVLAVVLGLPLLRGERPSLSVAVWAILLAVLVWRGASASIHYGRARRSAAGFDLRGLLEPVTVLDIRDSVAEIPPAPWGVQTSGVVLVDSSGTPVALLDADAVTRVAPGNRAVTPLTAVSTPLPPGVVVTEVVGPDALAQIARAVGAGPTLVATSPHGVLGTVDRERLLAALRPQRSQG